MRRLALFCLLGVVGCGAPPPDRVTVALQPDVISSESGALAARATVLHGDTELNGWTVKLHTDYIDRNNTMHAVDDASNKSNDVGIVDGAFSGLKWEGAGTVTASVFDDKGQPALDSKTKMPITAQATFSVVDESPPVVMITSPANGAIVKLGTNLDIQISATDEIGVSQIYVQATTANGNTQLDRTRSTIATGSTTVSGSFGFDTGNLQTAQMVTIYAMAADMSNNLGVAMPVTIQLQ